MKAVTKYFVDNVVKPWVSAMKRNNCLAYDIAQNKYITIQALYLLNTGEVGIRYVPKEKDDFLHLEWSDYDIIPVRISGSTIIVDSSKQLAHFEHFLSERPIFPKDGDKTVVLKIDTRIGKIEKLKYQDESKHKPNEILDAAVAKYIANAEEPFYDPARIETKNGFKNVLTGLLNGAKLKARKVS